MTYTPNTFSDVSDICHECDSPSTSPAEGFVNTPRRSLVRMQKSELANCYDFWPGTAVRVSLEDLSPAGLNFSTPQSLEVGQVVKIDSAQFKAVAEVAHCNREGDRSVIGARFLAVEFLRTTGSFFSTSA